MDFSRIKYRVDLLPETTKCIDEFPDLGDFAHIFDSEEDLPKDSNGVALVDNDKALRYLIYMYAPNSPLPLQIPDLNKRKQWALKAVNVEAMDESGEVNDGWKQLCLLSEDWAAKRFVSFCLIHDNGHKLVAETNLAVMANVAQRLLTGSSTEKAADLKNLREELTKAQEAYQEALEKLLMNEAAAKNFEYVRFTINAQNAGIRMEDAIKAFSERRMLYPTIIP